MPNRGKKQTVSEETQFQTRPQRIAIEQLREYKTITANHKTHEKCCKGLPNKPENRMRPTNIGTY